jgi:uncharacterized protein HemX
MWIALVLSLGLGAGGTLWALWRGAAAKGEVRTLTERLGRFEFAALKVDEAFRAQAKELDLTRAEMAEQIARREAVITTLKERLENAEKLMAKCSAPGAVVDQLRIIFSGD